MARPIPVSNQKIRDWNLFLTHLNERAAVELPRDASGKPDWSVLDKNEAFGNYTGGQDFYKKKFAEWQQKEGVSGADRLTEADFPVMQQLYRDVYAAAQNDPEYYNAKIQPTLKGQERLYNLDVANYNPNATTTGKDNAEGWVGSVSRNFFIPQDTHLGAGGDKTGQQDILKAVFPTSFKGAGETWWEDNPGGIGVRFMEKGGRLTAAKAKEILHDGTTHGKKITEKQRRYFGAVASGHNYMMKGGKLYCKDGGEFDVDEEDLELLGGGDLDYLDEGVAEVKGDTGKTDEVQVLANGKKVNVDDGEIIDMTNKEGRVYSEKLIDDETGKTFAEAFKEIHGKQKALDPNDKRDHVENKRKFYENQKDKLFERQQAKNGDASDDHAATGGVIDGNGEGDASAQVGPKKRTFYIPEDQMVVDVVEDKIPKYADKLKNAVEYTEVKPEGYVSDVHYFEKNGVLVTIPKDKLYAVSQQPEFKGSTELFPVQTTGQKKNKDVQSNYNELETKSNNGLFGPNGTDITNIVVTKKEVDDWDAQVKTYEDFLKKVPRKEDQMTSYNEVLETGYYDKLYPNDIDLLKAASRNMRDEANKDIGTYFIDDIEKHKDDLIQLYKVNHSATGYTYDILGNLSKTQEFKDYIDKQLDTMVSVDANGKTYNFSNMPDSQKEEIRNYVIGNYQTTQDLKKAQDHISVLVNPQSTGDPLLDDELNKQRQAIFNKTGVDITKLFGEEEALKRIKSFDEAMLGVNKEFADLASQLPYKIQKDVEFLKIKYDLDDNKLTEEGLNQLGLLQTDLQNQLNNGLIDQETADKTYKSAFNNLEMQRTEMFNKFNREYNQLAQQKLQFATEALEATYDERIRTAMKEAGIEGDDIIKIVEAYNKLVLWEVGNIQTDASVRLQNEANRLVDYKGDWEQIKNNLNRGTIQMFDSLGGGLKWLGWYEGGNILTDMMDEFNLHNPQHSVTWEGPESLMNKDWWIERGVTAIPFMATMAVPSLVTGGAAAGVAGEIGLTGAEATLFTGFSGALATRPLESFLEAGAQFQTDLENGMNVDEAGDRASNVFVNNMKLMFTDAAQIGLSFTKLGKLSGWKAGLIKAPLEMIMEGGEEVYQELIVEKLDNPYATYWNYIKSPAGQEVFALGGLMGLPFALPDIVSEGSGKNNQNQMGLLMDMLGDPNNLDVRYKQILDQANVLKARGMMTENEFKDLQTKAEFVVTKSKDIPVDLAPEVRKQVLYKLADIADANMVIAQSQDPTIQKTYQDKIKEIEKQVKELVTGKEPAYFIGNATYTEKEFKEVLKNDQVVENLAEQNTPIQVYNDPKLSEEVNVRMNQFRPDPELIHAAVNMPKPEVVIEENISVPEQQIATTETQDVTNVDVTETPVNTEIVSETPQTQENIFDILADKKNPSGQFKTELAKKHGKDVVNKAIFINKNFDTIVNDLLTNKKIKREC